jgi:hypothetical protein
MVRFVRSQNRCPSQTHRSNRQEPLYVSTAHRGTFSHLDANPVADGLVFGNERPGGSVERLGLQGNHDGAKLA